MPGIIVEEDADDLFDFDDWEELLAAADPAGPDVLSIDGSEATLVGRVPANKVRSAMAFFRGYSYCEDGKTLHRLQPCRHPVWPWLYVKSAQFHRHNPCANPDNVDDTPNVPAADPGTYTKTGRYLKSWVTLHFGPYPYPLYGDEDISFTSLGSKEFYRNCNIFESTEPNLETISAGTGRSFTFFEGDPQGKTFPGETVEYKISTALTIGWDNVAATYLFDEDGFAKKITQGIGCVNHDTFLGCPRGTLLLYPPRFRKYIQPVWTEDGQGLFAVDVKINMGLFDPEPGVGYGNSIYRGWQLMPWINGGNVDDTYGAGGVGWFSVQRPDGSAFLPSYDFEKLFEGVLVP